MILLLVFSILVSITAAIFALENTTAVAVTFLSYRFEGSLAVILMVVFGLGIVTATTALLPSFLSAKWQVLSLRRRVRQLEGKPPTDSLSEADKEAEDFGPPKDPPLPPNLPL